MIFAIQVKGSFMINNGLQISFVGICVVFLFLLFLIILIGLSSKILAPLTLAEEEAIKKSKNDQPEEDVKLTAVVTAAINKYRNRS